MKEQNGSRLVGIFDGGKMGFFSFSFRGHVSRMLAPVVVPVVAAAAVSYAAYRYFNPRSSQQQSATQSQQAYSQGQNAAGSQQQMQDTVVTGRPVQTSPQSPNYQQLPNQSANSALIALIRAAEQSVSRKLSIICDCRKVQNPNQNVACEGVLSPQYEQLSTERLQQIYTEFQNQDRSLESQITLCQADSTVALVRQVRDAADQLKKLRSQLSECRARLEAMQGNPVSPIREAASSDPDYARMSPDQLRQISTQIRNELQQAQETLPSQIRACQAQLDRPRNQPDVATPGIDGDPGSGVGVVN